MRTDDFLYGCRSGIQKAVRRGDLELGKLCFDALWENKVHRAWLKWRTVAIVQEEVSYYLGEMAEFMKKGEGSERGWRKMFYEVIVSPKQKDGFALMSLAKKNTKISHPEIEFSVPIFKANPLVDPSSVLVSLLKKIRGEREFSLYETNVIETLSRRVGMGGMVGDRQACLTNMVFILFRPLIKDEVRVVVDDAVRKYISEHGKTIKTAEERTLPWYVMDKHTAVGKIALSVFMRKHAARFGFEDVDQFWKVWFLLSSAFVPRSGMCYDVIKPNPTPFECIWEIPHIRASLPKVGGRTVKEMPKWWRDDVSKTVKRIVEWVIDVRGRNDS